MEKKNYEFKAFNSKGKEIELQIKVVYGITTKKAWKNAVKMYKHREKKMKDNSKIERYIQF